MYMDLRIGRKSIFNTSSTVHWVFNLYATFHVGDFIQMLTFKNGKVQNKITIYHNDSMCLLSRRYRAAITLLLNSLEKT